MNDDVLWPPQNIQLPDWDNGGGVAVLCGGGQHRVVRRGEGIVALDHPEVSQEAADARDALARGEIPLLGYRFNDTGFLIDDLLRWRKGHTWTDSGGRNNDPQEVGQIVDGSRLAPCVRLIVEGFVPCQWCGNLLAKGVTCTPDDDWVCVLSNGTGWHRSIPPGWVQGTQVGSPYGLSRSWPHRYRCVRNGPFTHHRQYFLSSPWWPELHPRRLKNLVCQYASDNGVRYGEAFDNVTFQLVETLGRMKPPPPI